LALLLALLLVIPNVSWKGEEVLELRSDQADALVDSIGTRL